MYIISSDYNEITSFSFPSNISAHPDQPDLIDSSLGNQTRVVTALVPYRIKKIGHQEEPSATRLTSDERLAKKLNIPFRVNYIINCSMEEFSELLNNRGLNRGQSNLCRDIRRRGKNKVLMIN